MEKSTRDRIFDFVRDRILAGVPPTVREVQARFGFKAVGTAREHLDNLIAEGRLAKLGGVSRGFRLPVGGKGNRPIRNVPILGHVQAGALTLAVEDPEGYIPVRATSSADDLFALRVNGDSMNQAGILPGDVVVVHRQPDADNGEVVVALVEDEATVKRLFKQTDHVELRPESDNPEFKPILLSGEAVRLLGKVIEVRRYL